MARAYKVGADSCQNNGFLPEKEGETLLDFTQVGKLGELLFPKRGI
jgi:hypothetical protein